MREYDKMTTVRKRDFDKMFEVQREMKQKYFEYAQKKAGDIGTVVRVLSNYCETYDALFEKTRENIKELRAVGYKETSKIYLEKYEEMIGGFNRTIGEEQHKALEEIHASMNEALEKLKGYMREPMSEDAKNDIEMIKLLGVDSFSKLEIKALLEKHQTNYLATKVISKLTNASNLGIKVLNADDLKDELEALRKNAVNFVHQYHGILDMTFAMMLEGSTLDAINNDYESFVANWYDSKKE